MSNGVILIKYLISPFFIAPRGSECENNLLEVMASVRQMLNLTFDPYFNVKWGHLNTKALDPL